MKLLSRIYLEPSGRSTVYAAMAWSEYQEHFPSPMKEKLENAMDEAFDAAGSGTATPESEDLSVIDIDELSDSLE
jgi:hypothetical protein